MERYDFTKNGGFPFTQDVLKDMQDYYLTMMQKLCGNFGPGPYIISGMVQSSGSISDGWFYYNGDVIPFTGGVIPTPAGGSVVLVQITDNTGTLAFNDGSTPVVKIGPTAALTTGATVTDATHFPLSALQLFGREANWNSIVIGASTGVYGGNVYYRKNYLTNTLELRGTISVNAPAVTSLAPTYLNAFTLPTGYQPANEFDFKANVSYSGGFIADTSGAHITGLNMQTGGAGIVTIGLIQGPTPYDAHFGVIIPLD